MHASNRARTSILTASMLVATALGGLAAAPQSGGFQAGDLYLYNPSYFGVSANGGGVVRIDPYSGAQTVLLQLLYSGSTGDQMAYDPWRDRLIFSGGLVLNQTTVYLCDASGVLQDLALSGVSSVNRFAPRGDGLIYFMNGLAPNNISYLDAANQLHVLMDASGTVPYPFASPPSFSRRMHYDAGTNALFTGSQNAQGTCPGGLTGAANLHRYDLSADGTRVLSEQCIQFDVDPNGTGEQPVGISPGPEGDLIVHINRGSGQLYPRIVRVRTEPFTVAPFAITPFGGTTGGTYSHLRKRAVIVESGNDELRLYSEGESGIGALLATHIDTPGIGGAPATLLEIQPTAETFGLGAGSSSISLSSGGSQAWSLEFGPDHAGSLHLVLGSRSGWTPATPVAGLSVPLVLDNYTLWTLNHQNTSLLPGSLGSLDAAGRASAALDVPPGTAPNLVGSVLYHSALVLDGTGLLTVVSNPVPVVLLP